MRSIHTTWYKTIMENAIVPLVGAKSKVWKFFGFRTDEKGRIVDKQKVICRVCDGCFSYCGNTTNLLYHLRTCHKKEYDTICPTATPESSTSRSQTTLPSLIASSKPYPRDSTRFRQCEQSLLKLICKNMLPVSFVDSEHFRSFVETLDPRFRRTVFLGRQRPFSATQPLTTR